MQPYTLAEVLARAIAARQNCQRAGNAEWLERHTDTIRDIERSYLPSGSGIDSGSQVDLDRSTADKIVITTAFHHMDDGGGYDGWTEHTITVRPSFIGGLSLTISGRNRDDIKEYLAETFEYVLDEQAPTKYQPRTVASVEGSTGGSTNA